MTERIIKNSGFVKDTQEPEHYVLGGGFIGDRKKIIKPDGQWKEVDFEPQNKGKFETFNCTSFNSLSALEILIREQFKLDANFSDRLLGIFAGTDPKQGGNSPHTVATTIRDSGVAKEEVLSYSDDLQTVEEYYSYKGGDIVSCVIEAEKFLDKYEFMHEWVFNEGDPINIKQAKMMNALKYSPLGVSVCAWKERDNVYYKDTFDEDNHWTCVVGYAEGQFWFVFDSYEPAIKRLEWNYDFSMAKMYFIFERTSPRHKNWIIDLFKNFIKIIKKICSIK